MPGSGKKRGDRSHRFWLSSPLPEWVQLRLRRSSADDVVPRPCKRNAVRGLARVDLGPLYTDSLTQGWDCECELLRGYFNNAADAYCLRVVDAWRLAEWEDDLEIESYKPVGRQTSSEPALIMFRQIASWMRPRESAAPLDQAVRARAFVLPTLGASIGHFRRPLPCSTFETGGLPLSLRRALSRARRWSC